MAEIRVSSAERDDAVAALGAHHSTGRLSLTDYERRRQHAIEARTRAEIEALFDDLPSPHPDLSLAVTPRPLALVHPEWPGGRVGTRASHVMDVIGVLSLLVGLPIAIVLTAAMGLWWTFLIVVGAGVLAMVLGVALMTQPAEPQPSDEPHD
ncbi:DUF1707 domain-containing protein [Actinophytocola sp.]|uniref:DUF1707 SHOCT-like domain-containing protein n=1 Tax=Actinophytocola sp. TaxID=1872138 RepID=UPI002ED910B4